MRTIIRWLKPTRLDRYLLVLVGLLFFALIGVEMVGDTTPKPGAFSKSLAIWLVAPFLLAVFSIAAVIGSGGLKAIRQRVLFLLLVQSIAILFGWVLVKKNVWGLVLGDCFSPEYLKLHGTELELSWIHILSFLLVFGFIAFASCFANFVLSIVWKRVVASGQMRRAKTILVGVFLVFAVGAVAVANKVNIFEELSNFGFSNGQPVSITQMLLVVSLLLFGLIAPALILRHRKSFFGSSFFVWIVYGASFGPLALMWRSYASYLAPGSFTVDDAVSVVLISFAINVIVAFLILPSESKDGSEKDESTDSVKSTEQRNSTSFQFSCLSLCLLGFVICLISGSAIAFVSNSENGLSLLLKEEAEDARVARVLDRIDSFEGVSTTIIPSQGVFRSSFRVEFENDGGEGYFKEFSELITSLPNWIEIRGMGADVNVKPIRGLFERVSFVDCDLSQTQLVAILANCRLVVFRNCRFNQGDSVSTFDLEIYAIELAPGQTANLLSYLAKEFLLPEVSICTKTLDERDWLAILDRCKYGPVSLQIQEMVRFKDVGMQLSDPLVVENLTLGFDFDSTDSQIGEVKQLGLPKEFWRFALQNESEVSTPILGQLSILWQALGPVAATSASGLDRTQGQQFWDALFVANRVDVSFPISFSLATSIAAIEESGRKYHWCFDPPSDVPTPIRSLILPVFGQPALASIGQMPELQRLSFDPAWLQNGATFDTLAGTLEADLNHLGTLVKLQELYLPVGVRIKSWDFLGSMKELRKIQFDSFRDEESGPLPFFDPVVHSNLQEVTTFHLPSPTQLFNLKNLPSLTRLVIKDELSEINPTRLKLIQRMFGEKVEVVVVSKNDPIPLPPEFLEHLDRVREIVRTRYLGPQPSNPVQVNGSATKEINESPNRD